MRKTITYRTKSNKIRIQVSDDGKLYNLNGKEINQYRYAKGGYIGTSVRIPGTKKQMIIYTHRAVLQAFGKGRKGKVRCFADHIDGNVENNSISNLRWVSRKENNSTALKKERVRKNYKYTPHKGQIIKGVNKITGETKYWKNGMETARDIGCSHVLVYNVINPDYPARYAKGWSLKWVDMQEAL